MSTAPPGSAQSATKKPTKQRKLFTLWVHDVHFSAVDLVINPDYFPPETKLGDIVEIYKQGNKEKALYLAIGALTTIRANLHLSVKDTIASACELTNREEIVANVVSKESVAVDFAEVTFKDQFISRSDMWRLKMHLKETCAYVGKSISYSCIRASIRELLSSEQPVHSGYITPNTKIVFRSRSAEYIMLFQMSREMWDFAPDGQLYFEKAVNKFLPSLFSRWRSLGANHCLSMVMFSRTYYDHADLFDLSSFDQDTANSSSAHEMHSGTASHESTAANTATSQAFSRSSDADHHSSASANGTPQYSLNDPPPHLCRMDSVQQSNLLRDHEGRYYHDFYTVVCIEERTNWERVVLQLKTKFEEYPYMVNWKVRDANPDKYHSNVLGNNATAEHSGFLEAINLAQNMLDSRHFTDRDLTRTGQSVVVISAGTGIFIVNPSLEHQTKQRMIDKGIGCDLVCVTKPPLHVVPLFIMKRPYTPAYSTTPEPPMNLRSGGNSVSSGSTPSRALTPASPYSMNSSSILQSQTGTKPAKQSFPSHKIAHWVYLFFHDLHVQHDPGSVSRNFTANCTMPDFLQRNNDCSGIVLPLKMKPNVAVAPSTATSQSTKGSAIVGSLGGLVSVAGLGGLLGAPPAAASEKGSKTDPTDADRLGMVHHMDMDVSTTLLSSETSQTELLAQLMDAYDSSLFAPAQQPSSQSKHAHLSSGNGITQPSGLTGTPRGGGLGTPHHAHSTSLLNSPGPILHSPASHSTLERASTLSGPLSSAGPGSGKKSTRDPSSLSVSAAAPRGASLHASSQGVTLSGAAAVTTSSLSSAGWRMKGSASVRPSSAVGEPGTMAVPTSSVGASSILGTPSSSVNSVQSSFATIPGVELSHSSLSAAHLKTPSKANLSAVPTVRSPTELSTNETGVVELNPFTLELKPAPPASNRRRWEHLWVRHSIQFDFLESDPSGPHWKSLTQPASLPLTTSYFPSQKDLKDHFHFYSHSVDPDDSVHEMPLEAHLTEHIAQRLVQGAQIMLQDGATLNPNNAYLSAGNSFHNLTIKQPNIIVNWYVAKNKVLQHEPIQYKYFLWTEHTSRRLSKAIDLHYKSIIQYPWNTLDQLLSGYQLEFMDNYNFWHINMMLVPSDAKMTTQNAVAAFNKFKEILTQRIVKLQDPDFGPMHVDIHISPTSAPLSSDSDSSSAQGSHNAASAASSAFSPATASSSFRNKPAGGASSASSSSLASSASSASVPELIESHNTNLILASLRESNLVNEHYLRKGDRERRGSETEKKTNIFIASKVVDWMLTHVSVRNRTEAIDICDGLVSSGVFTPVSLPKDSKFRDGANFYAISDPHAPHPSPNSSSSSAASSSKGSIGKHTESPGSAPIERRQASTGPYASVLPHTSQSHKMITPTSKANSSPKLQTPNVLQAILGWKRSSAHAKDSPTPDTLAAIISNENLENTLGSLEANEKLDKTVLAALKAPETASLSSEAVERAKNLALLLKPHASEPDANQELVWLFERLLDCSVISSKQGAKVKLKSLIEASSSITVPRAVRSAESSTMEPSAAISDAGILMVSEELHHNESVRLKPPTSVVQPGSQPMESSPLDLAPGGGNLGSNLQTHHQGVNLGHGSSIPMGVTHQFSDPSFTRAERVIEDPSPSLPHHTHAPSGAIRLAMDPSKTDRYEWVNVVYDTIFDPSVAYEFQFQWLCSTGCVLSEFLTQLVRKAKGLGLSLIQIPVKHDVVHSFLSPRKDSFSWADLPSMHQLAVCHVLVKVLDFLPRKRANQFIHRSGVIIIDISNNIFEWTVNWTDVNAYTTAQNFELLKRFRDFMHQVAALKAQSVAGQPELTYHEFLAGLLQKVAPFSAQSLPHPPFAHSDSSDAI
jgi:hypothetical protein